MGARSRAAAQILAGQGFKTVYNFKGGIKAWNGHSVTGSADTGMMLLKGDERPAEIVSLAFQMEAALGQFYISRSKTAEDPDVSALFAHLADIESKHRDRLLALYRSFVGSPVDGNAVGADTVSDIVEGGFTVDEFETQNRSALQTTADVLSLAMMLEAQAMDLYMRYAHARVDTEDQKILFQLADEEKAHLVSLGAMLEQKI